MKRFFNTPAASMTFVLLTVIYLIFAVNLLMPSRDFSEAENRSLEQRPTLSLGSLLDGTFTSDFERYISDQFMLRDIWIGIKSGTDQLLGKKESNGVYIGRDGYLLQKFNPPADSELQKKAETLNGLASMAPGVHTYVMLAPTALSVLTEKVPNYVAGEKVLEKMEKVRGQLQNVSFVDVYPALHAKRNEEIYYRTDHHWTMRGAFYAYRELGKQMGFMPKEEKDFTIRQVSNAFYGTQYSASGYKFVQPDSVNLFLPKFPDDYTVEYTAEKQTSASLYNFEYLNKKDKYALFMNGNHALVKIKTGSQEKRKLLVVKDSYANSLVPFLTPHFSEIFVVDPRYYEEDIRELLEDNEIHDMLVLYNLHTFFEDESLYRMVGPVEKGRS
ncbi:DHHW family protein [Paenibacillus chitinolyticus]|uniref:DHHW family protein n=1 Tax=Paenibacillus chitinolyticus TaxID=79263 RepID=UPI0035D6F27C